MRTLVITGGESSIWGTLDLTLPSKYKWCQKYGYDILVKRTWPGKPEFNFEEGIKHVGFLRVVTCFEQLKHYDNVIWLDADSIITNQDYKIEDFIDEQHCFFASYNWMVPENTNKEFTTGNFIIKRTPFPQIEQLYNTFIQTSKYFLNNICVELATLNTVYNTTPLKEVMKILPHRYLNACPECLIQTQTWKNDNNRTGIVSPWNEDCFLAHLTGCSNIEREEVLKEHFKNYL
jgi:hypothetical protein